MSDQSQQSCDGHVVKCANCSEKPGRDPNRPSWEVCPVCKGVGSVLLK